LNTSNTGVLLRIIALARSGALDRALRLFNDEGLETVADDAAVLSVKGRLLKDQARRGLGDDRMRLWRAAGDAYGRAADISGATYHLINAATLSLLGGDAGLAGDRARRVLETLDSGQDIAETPYYLAATRAEALLLLSRRDEAEAALRQAVRLAPSAWEDHATTRRQFRLILSVTGEDDGWVELLRPPSSLHFAGPMIQVETPQLREAIDRLLQDSRTGFAFGALAGGADIIVAEAVLDHGAELEVVLPFPPGRFRATSVEPLGRDWPVRFDRILSRSTLRPLQESAPHATGLAQVKIAAEVAMGRAAMNARALSDEAMQLILADEADGVTQGSVTQWIETRWRRSMRPQHIIGGKSTSDVTIAARADIAHDGLFPAAVLVCAFDEAVLETGHTTSDALDLLERLDRSSRDLPLLMPPAQVGRTIQAVFAEPGDAAEAAHRIVAICGDRCRIAGHYAVADWKPGLFGARALAGSTTIWPERLLTLTPAGAIYVSETFAMALQSISPDGTNHAVCLGDAAGAPHSLEVYALDPEAR